MKRGGPLRRGSPLRRGGGLRAVSLKRRRETPTRKAVCAEVERRDGPGCYAGMKINERRATAIAHGWPLTCAGPFDFHEVIPRSVLKDAHLLVWNVRKVCRRHHEWIGAYEVTAATLGLHGYSWDRPV